MNDYVFPVPTLLNGDGLESELRAAGVSFSYYYVGEDGLHVLSSSTYEAVARVVSAHKGEPPLAVREAAAKKKQTTLSLEPAAFSKLSTNDKLEALRAALMTLLNV